MDETYKISVKQALYNIYERIFLLAYDKGLDLNKAIQDVGFEIETLKKEKDFECEPDGYTGLWMVHSLADKLHVPVSQLFISDLKLKNRVIEDILNVAISEKNGMSVKIGEQGSSIEAQIEFSVKRRSSFSTWKEVETYCAELKNYNATKIMPNDDRVISKYLIRLTKENGVYSIFLSGYSHTMLNSAYIYEMVKIYSEEHGRVQNFVDECVSNTISSKQTLEESKPIEVKDRELPFPEATIDNLENTELVAVVYDTTRTMDILNKFEGLETNGKPYERLVISNGWRVGIGSKYWIHLVVERCKNQSYVGDITFTNFKLGRVSELRKHIKEELALVNIEDFVDMDVYIKFNTAFHLRAQNKRNRTGYGWEWDWSGGVGDCIEGTLYGETTDYIFSGAYISSDNTYKQNKRKKMFAKEHLAEEIETGQVYYYKLVVDGYVKGEYTLVVNSSQLIKRQNKRTQLYIKAERDGKKKTLPVSCDSKNKLLYINKATYDFYREQIIMQQPLILYNVYA